MLVVPGKWNNESVLVQPKSINSWKVTAEVFAEYKKSHPEERLQAISADENYPNKWGECVYCDICGINELF